MAAPMVKFIYHQIRVMAVLAPHFICNFSAHLKLECRYHQLHRRIESLKDPQHIIVLKFQRLLQPQFQSPCIYSFLALWAFRAFILSSLREDILLRPLCVTGALGKLRVQISFYRIMVVVFIKLSSPHIFVHCRHKAALSCRWLVWLAAWLS